jgi:hexosaminidase
VKRSIALLILCLATRCLAATGEVPAVIPQPEKMKVSQGVFHIGRGTRIMVDGSSGATGEYLADRLRASTGCPFEISTNGEWNRKGRIEIRTNAEAGLGAEGYRLDVGLDSAVISAPTQAGLFYGVQTLLQLLPPEVFGSKTASNIDWKIPCVEIEDRPRFPWRGFMLDVCRHFYDKEQVKRVLDAMALHKLNTFHWHLVDDQGWRIEIKKYPKLTEVGAWRPGIGFDLDPKASGAYDAKGRYGGYYTQDDIREVVAYAASRHITVVPEIEMPGHATAALAAYPEFSCTGGPFTMPLRGGIFDAVFCVGNDATFDFLQDVLTEVFALFPGKYVHVGGDEVRTTNWQHCPKCQARMKAEGLTKEVQLEGYLIRRIEKFISAHGKMLIGWSEVYDEGVGPSAAVMDWTGAAMGAATNGHDVVMAPERYIYLDHYQSTNHSTEPRAIGGAAIPLNRVYSFEPVPAALPADFAPRIIGTQGNLWTEYIASLEHVEFMMFPRLTAIAEIGWSPKSARNWTDFSRRLQTHYERLDQLGILYRHYPYNLPARP